MAKAICKYCKKEFIVSPSDVIDIEDYHCRDCNPLYMEEQKEEGKKIKYDWSTIKKLNRIAMSNGHKSIFSNEVRGVKPEERV